jgi:spermidine/putrescine transport system substrate-binding protein
MKGFHVSSAEGSCFDGRSDVPASLARGLLSRRTMLAGLGAAGLSALLSGCGTKGIAYAGPAADKQAPDRSGTDKLVNWSNWPEYIDVDDKTKKRPTLNDFTAKTGIKVNYTEDYNDNDEFFAKVKPQLTANADTGRDVWCATDWMVARLIRLNWVQKLDKANIPNAANLVDSLRNVSFDPGRVYSIPWQSGFTGIGYNPKSTGGRKIDSMDQLLHDPVLKGKVTLLKDFRDSLGLMLLGMGKNPSKFSDSDFDAALRQIEDAKKRGQLKGFTGNEYGQGLASGDIAACTAWTGDVVQLKADDPKLGYVLPRGGHMLWSDNFVIPNRAQHKKNAELLINYYYDPTVMATVEDYVNYIPPVQKVKQALQASDPTVADNPLIFPDDQVQAESHVFMGLSGEQEARYTRAWQAVMNN